jgi:hypothetical protein
MFRSERMHVFQRKISSFFVLTLRTTRPFQLIALNLILLAILGEEYELCNSSLCELCKFLLCFEYKLKIHVAALGSVTAIRDCMTHCKGISD